MKSLDKSYDNHEAAERFVTALTIPFVPSVIGKVVTQIIAWDRQKLNGHFLQTVGHTKKNAHKNRYLK